MKKINRLTGLSLWMAIVMILSGCQVLSPTQEDVLNRNNTLKFMLPAPPSTFDPGLSGETFSGVVVDHAFETLVSIDEKGNLQPGAAESWTISEEGLTYTFKLQKNGKWSNGTPIVAEDFKRSWLRVIDPETKSLNAAIITPYIKGAAAFNGGTGTAADVGIKVVDDTTLEVVLNSPTSYFLQLITFWCFAPVHAESVATTGWDMKAEAFISNGAYKVKTIEAGKSVLLTRNPHYWNAKAVQIAGIEVLFKQEGQNPYEMYKNGEIDGVYEVPYTDLRTITDLETDVYIHQAISTAFIFVNHDHPLLGQQTFREALGLSMDRQKVVDDALLGGGIASRYLVPSSMTLAGENFHEFTTLNPPPDLVKAKEQMSKTDFSAKAINEPIRVYYLLGRTDGETMEVLTKAWTEAFGLNFELKGMEWPALYEASQKGDYDIAMMGFGGDYPHPMTFIGMFLPASFGTEISNWEDADFQKAIYDSLSIQDQKEALIALRNLESTIIDEYHILPVYHRKLLGLMNDRVEGWHRDSLLHYNFERATLKPQ